MTNFIPQPLQEIIDFYESLPEDEKREALINEAAQAEQYAPQKGEIFSYTDIRKDNECSDTVGIFVKISKEGRLQFNVSLGDEVQTLTRALTSILCKGLRACSVSDIRNLPENFIPRIVGSELHRLRSRTIYYMLRRLKEATKNLESN